MARKVQFDFPDICEEFADPDLDGENVTTPNVVETDGEIQENGEQSGQDANSDAALDSEDYDTDLENPEEEEADYDRLGIRLYERMCQRLHTFPQKVIVDGLSQTSIVLANRSLGPGHIRPLAAALMKNLRVVKLDLGWNDLSTEGAICMANLLTHNSHSDLSHVDLSNCNLCDVGGMAMGDMLHLNKALRILDLSGNKFGVKAGRSIASALRVNRTLMDLNLSHNNLSEEGAAMLGQAIGQNESLTRLDLSWNKIRTASAVAIGMGLEVNDTLMELDVSWNGFGYEGALALKEALKVNRTLQILDASNNRIMWDGALLISQGLAVNGTLEQLRLGGNPLTTTGCMDLIEAVSREQCALSKLDLKGMHVLGEFQMMVVAIKQTRQFECRHGGMVSSHDILGQRFGRRIAPMQRVMDYMKAKEIRPTELFRSFDKAVANQLTQEELIVRLKKAGIPLLTHEIVELLRTIKSQADDSALDYKSVKLSVQEQVEKERRYQIEQKERALRLRQYHKQILNPKLPPLPERALLDIEDFDLSHIESEPEYLLNQSMRSPGRATVPGAGLSGIAEAPPGGKPLISMSRPLGSKPKAFGAGGKKTKKKKKSNSKGKKSASKKSNITEPSALF